TVKYFQSAFQSPGDKILLADRISTPKIPDLRFAHPGMTGPIASAVHFQRGNKRFLRNVDLAELPHLLLAFLLLLQKFSFTRDVAAVAFCGDVLAQRAHGFARDHLAADCRL